MARIVSYYDEVVLRRLLLWGLLAVSVLWAAALLLAPDIVSLAGSYLCHQRPERSFWIGGRPMPVCSRCAGLYLAAPLGVALVLWGGVPWRHVPRREIASLDRTYSWWRLALIIAALPTIGSLAIEWLAGLTCNESRALTAIPLGMAVAGLIAAVVRGDFAETGS